MNVVTISTEDLEKMLRDVVEEEVGRRLDPLLAMIVMQQKDVCDATGISPGTIRNKVARGELDVLQRDGSRLNYLTLKKAGELKPRRKARRPK